MTRNYFRMFAMTCAMLLSIQITAQDKELGESTFGSLRARQIGPATMSGRVSTLDVVNKTPKIMYVGAAGGGVWKSNSAGADFRSVFDDYPQSIGKITIDQKRPDTVWVGTGETWVRNSVSVGEGIFKTTDGGNTWKNMGLEKSERIADIIIHPENPNTVFVAAMGGLWHANEERGIYKTEDGGATWDKVFYIDENTGCSDLAIDPKEPNTMYATMWSYRRYPWSFNSGMVGIDGYEGKSGVFKTTDGGKNWVKIQEGLPKGALGRLAIAVAPSNSDVLYLTVETKEKKKKGIYKSTDKGATWEFTNGDFGSTVRPFYFSNIIVDPKDENKVFKCGLNLTISDDGAKTFRTVGSGVHSDAHDVWIDPNNTNHIIVGTDGGVYESYDGGYLFKMYMNLPISQFYHVSIDNDEPYNVYGGLQDNGSWYAPSQKAGGIGNSDWQNTYGGDGFYSFRHPEKKDIIFAEYQGGNLVRYNSKTGVAKDIRPYPTADEPKYRWNWNSPIHLSPNNPNRMYFGSQFLFMSDNMGDTWTKISPDLTTNDPEKQKQNKSGGISIDNSTAENNTTIYAIAESPLDPNMIWAGTDDGNLQVTTDGGKTWTNTTKNIEGFGAEKWITFIEPSHHDKNVVLCHFRCPQNGRQKGLFDENRQTVESLGKTLLLRM